MKILVLFWPALRGERHSDELFTALHATHARIAAGASWWAAQLEVSYIPQQALRRYDPAHAIHPHIDRGEGESLHLMEHHSDWVIQRYILRERGIILAGVAPQTLIDPISPDDLRQAMLALLWWPAQIVSDPARMNEYKRGYQSYLVLSMCHILYTLQHGAVVSKSVAAQWAKETLGERWRPLIERAWIGRQHPLLEASPEDVSGTLDLIRYTVESSRQFAA